MRMVILELCRLDLPHWSSPEVVSGGAGTHHPLRYNPLNTVINSYSGLRAWILPYVISVVVPTVLLVKFKTNSDH
jgi:hypothetical protein